MPIMFDGGDEKTNTHLNKLQKSSDAKFVSWTTEINKSTIKQHTALNNKVEDRIHNKPQNNTLGQNRYKL